jgi:HlyD family secretion protein
VALSLTTPDDSGSATNPKIRPQIRRSANALAFANRLFVRTFIPEGQLGSVKNGAAATVTVAAFPGRTFAAHLTEISPDAEFTPKAVETRAERVNLVYAAKADLDRGWNEPLVPGQPAEVEVRQ